MVLCLVTSTDLETRRAGLSAETELLVKEIFRTAQPEARPEGPTAVWGSWEGDNQPRFHQLWVWGGAQPKLNLVHSSFKIWYGDDKYLILVDAFKLHKIQFKTKTNAA